MTGLVQSAFFWGFLLAQVGALCMGALARLCHSKAMLNLHLFPADPGGLPELKPGRCSHPAAKCWALVAYDSFAAPFCGFPPDPLRSKVKTMFCTNG